MKDMPREEWIENMVIRTQERLLSIIANFIYNYAIKFSTGIGIYFLLSRFGEFIETRSEMNNAFRRMFQDREFIDRISRNSWITRRVLNIYNYNNNSFNNVRNMFIYKGFNAYNPAYILNFIEKNTYRKITGICIIGGVTYYYCYYKKE